jgi:hypothetical protein
MPDLKLYYGALFEEKLQNITEFSVSRKNKRNLKNTENRILQSFIFISNKI